MHRNCHAVCWVVRELEHTVAGERYVGIIAGNEQVTFGVVSARTSYDINEFLIYLVDESVGFSFAVRTAPPVPQ